MKKRKWTFGLGCKHRFLLLNSRRHLRHLESCRLSRHCSYGPCATLLWIIGAKSLLWKNLLALPRAGVGKKLTSKTQDNLSSFLKTSSKRYEIQKSMYWTFNYFFDRCSLWYFWCIPKFWQIPPHPKSNVICLVSTKPRGRKYGPSLFCPEILSSIELFRKLDQSLIYLAIQTS